MTTAMSKEEMCIGNEWAGLRSCGAHPRVVIAPQRAVIARQGAVIAHGRAVIAAVIAPQLAVVPSVPAKDLGTPTRVGSPRSLAGTLGMTFTRGSSASQRAATACTF